MPDQEYRLPESGDDELPKAEPPVPGPDPRILEEVLQRTVLLSSDLSDAEADIACLRPVATRFAGRGIDSEQVLPELIRAMLGRVFGREVDRAWDPMVLTIAGSLLDDPTARVRVEKLWKRLCAS